MSGGLFFVVSLMFTVGHVTGQIVYRGKCKEAPVQDNFNLTRFAGTWHETSRSFTFFELLMRCVQTEYSVTEGGKVDIKIFGVDAIGSSRSFNGKAETKDSSQPARLKAKFRIIPMAINYNVLKTDYDNYAILWSCNNMFGGRLGHTEQLWIMSRKSVLDDFLKSQIYEFLDQNNIKRRYLEGNAKQEKCFTEKTADVVEITTNATTTTNNSTSVIETTTETVETTTL